MNLLLYYIVHAFKNSIKKIFKSKVVLIIFAFILIGGIVGGTIGVIANKYESKSNQTEISDNVKEQDNKEEDNNIDKSEEMDESDMLAIVEMVVGGVVILITLVSVANGEKSGSKIFTMADINFLFPSPKKPQSVLMFKVVLQMGLILVSSIYILFQLPNLILNLGLSTWNAVVILSVWIIILIIGKLISVCTYTIVATHNNLRKFVRPIIYGIISILLIIYFLLISVGSMSKFDAAKYMFTSKGTRWIPVWGWIRGIVMYSIEGNIFDALMCLLGIVLLSGLFIYVIWHIKADFYEDALSSASEMQEKITAMSEGRTMVLKRSKKIKSGEIGRGEGANVFLFKHLYNRKRNARFGVITKTMETFFVMNIFIALLTRFAAKSDNIIPLSAMMIFVVFFRSFENPIVEESSKNFLYLVPENSFKKLFYSLIGGTFDSFLNILPAYFIAVIIIGGDLSAAICWFILFISFDFLTSCTGLFIDMMLPTYIADAIRKMMLILLDMLCIMAIGIIIVVVAFLTTPFEALIVAIVLFICIGMGLCYLSQKILHKGRS
ncbi:MAG: putative ABC exporter domain-containing protein [Clostridiaceae bacterium]